MGKEDDRGGGGGHLLLPQIHQKYIYMQNYLTRKLAEGWQKNPRCQQRKKIFRKQGRTQEKEREKEREGETCAPPPRRGAGKGGKTNEQK